MTQPGGAVPSVTVLIATRGRPESLVHSLRSILGCDYPAFDVLVVDQSAPEQRMWIPSDPRLRRIASKTLGKSRGLNEGLAQLTGEFVAFTDDDCTVPADWIDKAVRILRENPRAGIVYGPLVAAPHDSAEGMIPVIDIAARRILRGRAESLGTIIAGANMVARRTALEQIDGFDGSIGPGTDLPASEEFDLLYRLAGAGWDVVLDPDNPVTHWGLRPWSDGSAAQLLRLYRRGSGAVLGKHLRCGDALAAGEVFRTVLRDIYKLGQEVMSFQRPHPRGLFYFLGGVAAAASRRVVLRTRKFATAAGEGVTLSRHAERVPR